MTTNVIIKGYPFCHSNRIEPIDQKNHLIREKGIAAGKRREDGSNMDREKIFRKFYQNIDAG